MGGLMCVCMCVNGETSWQKKVYLYIYESCKHQHGIIIITMQNLSIPVVASFTIHLDFLLHCLPFWFLACHLPFQSDASFSSLWSMKYTYQQQHSNSNRTFNLKMEWEERENVYCMLLQLECRVYLNK